MAEEGRGKRGFRLNLDHDDGGRGDVSVGRTDGETETVEIWRGIGRNGDRKGGGLAVSRRNVGQFVILPLDVPSLWNGGTKTKRCRARNFPRVVGHTGCLVEHRVIGGLLQSQFHTGVQVHRIV